MKSKHTSLLSLLIVLCILLSYSAMAVVQSINYPAPNDIISETARIRLSVTSTDTSSTCYFNYDNVKNVSVACNGTTLVNLPNADNTYRIIVGDEDGSSINQQVTVVKAQGVLVTAIYILDIIIILACFFILIYTIDKFSQLDVTMIDLGMSWTALFGLFLSYQLSLEYLNMPFMLDWLNLILNTCTYSLGIISLIGFIVSAIHRATTSKGDMR